MAIFKMLHGDGNHISTDVTPFHEGWCYITHSGEFYVDLNIGTEDSPNNQRIQINEAFTKNLLNITNDISYLDGGTITQEGVDTNG
jgi:hypothetical protein